MAAKKLAAKKPTAKKQKSLSKMAERLKKTSAAAKSLPVEKEAKALPKGFKMPKTLAACADKLYTTREERLSLNKNVEEFKAVEGALKTHIIDNLPKSNATGITGRLAGVTISTKDIPQPDDWHKLYKGIVDSYLAHVKKKTGNEDSAFDILNRALSTSTVEERINNGAVVPGVKFFKAVTVSISKV